MLNLFQDDDTKGQSAKVCIFNDMLDNRTQMTALRLTYRLTSDCEEERPNILITTEDASIGLNLFKEALVVLTYEPDDVFSFGQIAGRGCRRSYTDTKSVVYVTEEVLQEKELT